MKMKTIYLLIYCLFMLLNINSFEAIAQITKEEKTVKNHEIQPVPSTDNREVLPRATSPKGKEVEEKENKIIDKQAQKISIDHTPEHLRDYDLEGIEWHQMYLDRPAESLELIKYKDDSGHLKGEISKDGKRILFQNYTKRGQVQVKVKYKDGTVDEFIKSSCFIDPVAPL